MLSASAPFLDVALEPFRSRWIVAQPAESPSLRAAYFALRRQVFVVEQRLFSQHDLDAHDLDAHHLVALTTCAGVPDEVVGVVRIYPIEPGAEAERDVDPGAGAREQNVEAGAGVRERTEIYARAGVRDGSSAERVWFGGRLGVARPFRRTAEVGASLIRAAVGTARGLGASRFLATVQRDNVAYFERYHFSARELVTVCGQPHCLMEADLTAFVVPHWLRDRPGLLQAEGARAQSERSACSLARAEPRRGTSARVDA